jgi:hypothetical protein
LPFERVWELSKSLKVSILYQGSLSCRSFWPGLS